MSLIPGSFLQYNKNSSFGNRLYRFDDGVEVFSAGIRKSIVTSDLAHQEQCFRRHMHISFCILS